MLTTIRTALAEGSLIPYIGPGVLALAGADCPVPLSPATLVGCMTSKISVPHKIRNNLTGTAQFIENFKHRKSVVALMRGAFAVEAEPTVLHRWLAEQLSVPLIVHAWYDDLPQRSLASRSDWGMVQGVSQAEHFGTWTHAFHADGSAADAGEVAGWRTVLYEPFGSIAPAANFLVSDSDFVEVLTEIDIQTPIPEAVQSIRAGRHFLYLGCRFSTQLERGFAHQISKRSSDSHWAVLPEAPTRNELRFLEQHGIQRIDMTLADFVAELTAVEPAVAA